MARNPSSHPSSKPAPEPRLTSPNAPRGLSLLAGTPVARTASAGSFHAVNPASGQALPIEYQPATRSEIDDAARAAWIAFGDYVDSDPKLRGAFLDRCADGIAALGDDLIQLAAGETGLGPARLVSERERTVNSLRMFADLVREGSWVRAAIDHGDAARRPLAKPDVRRMLRPLGPVAVFGASNFPLAYSTAGGDTASALAAGCPVIVKGHPSHPGTGELVAQAIAAAVEQSRLPAGTFSFLHAGGPRESEIGLDLVRHPCVRAVGFTGSLGGGTALAREAAARPDPIPVFAEMGSVNPVFVLPHALELQAKSIGERLFTSVTNGAGQMCTCPGLIIGVRSDGLELLTRTLAESMNQTGPMTMLSRRVRAGFVTRVEQVLGVRGVDVRGGSPQPGHRSGTAHEQETGFSVRCSAVLFRTTFEIFRKNPTLAEECFGPSSIVVVCDSPEQLVEAAALIPGSLTGSIFAGGLDVVLAADLQRVLEQRVGRIVYNGVPTGVEVCTAMVHGGPYPSSNQPHTTAVGPLAVERWCRPLAYQNVPEQMLPHELRDANVRRVVRHVDGVLQLPPTEDGDSR